MITNLNTGMALKKTSTPHDPEKELRDRMTEIIYLTTKLRNAKQTCVGLDEERQKIREVSRKIIQEDIDPVWIYNGSCFLQTSKKNSLEILEIDKKTVEDVREQIQDVIKKDTDTFLKLHKERNLSDRGFDLKPVLRNGKITN